MKISDARINLAAQSTQTQREEKTERLQVWVGQAPTQAAPTRDSLSLSPRALAAASAAPAAMPVDEDEGLDPKLRLLKAMIRALTGHDIHTLTARDLAGKPTATRNAGQASVAAPAPARQGWGLDYYAETKYAESQQLSFSAQGIVTTTDGREIAFDLQLDVQRQFVSKESIHIIAGDAAIDPLVVNLQGFTGTLADTQFSFDLDADGTLEAPHTLRPGSGFLVFDRNGDGQIRDGRELFGPKTGNGFAELAALDSDGNAWIDEADAAYDKLALWSPDAEGKGALVSLASASIGAIYLRPTSAPFTLKDAANVTTGESRSIGVYLHEDGTPGTMQQVDLVG